MNVQIHGLAAFSYTRNKERDDQGSMVIAFARAVMAISIGIKIQGTWLKKTGQTNTLTLNSGISI